MATLVHNERIKCAATFLTNIAAALAAIGAILPAYGLLADKPASLLLIGACVVVGLAFFSAAYLVLGLLRE
jgi:mannose/fructose/N-acetylgalactosamine-specific phosphotransferase system component IID